MTTISEIKDAYVHARSAFNQASLFLARRGHPDSSKLPWEDERDLAKFVSEQKWDEQQKREFKSHLETSAQKVYEEFIPTVLVIAQDALDRQEGAFKTNLPFSTMFGPSYGVRRAEARPRADRSHILEIWLDRFYAYNFKNLLEALRDVRERREFFQTMCANIQLGERQGKQLGKLNVGNATKRGILNKIREHMKFGKRRSRKIKSLRKKSRKRRSRKRS